MDAVTITLAKPVLVVGDLRATLTFGELNGGMLMRAGPYMRIVHQEGADGVEIKPDGIAKLIAASANIPLRAVESLSAQDFMRAQQVIIDFLGLAEDPETGKMTVKDPASSTP